MGKRRIRCLKALNETEIRGVDLRSDRRNEAAMLHGIAVFPTLEAALATGPADALVISVPPDLHHIYMAKGIELRLPFFIEASVVDTGMGESAEACRRHGLLAAPSATMLFHPAIRQIAEIIKNGELGVVSNIVHHMGNYLPDWHTYEHVRDFYVSKKATGGAREIVPFEMTWLAGIFGLPQRVAGHVRKTIVIEGAEEIDDTYNCILDYGKFLMVLLVDVVARPSTRRTLINGSKGQLIWDWSENCVRVYDSTKDIWDRRPYDAGQAAAGYNANIGETMYIEEIRNFLDAVRGSRPFPNTLEKDHAVLRLLYAVEEADRTSRIITLKP
jgi:predicted dehydrogenase